MSLAKIAAGAATLVMALLTAFVGAGAGFLGQQPALACRKQPFVSDHASAAIPGRYLALYRDAGAGSGIDWSILAAIGRVESDHGRSTGAGVKSGANPAGAAGPMQFGIGGRAGNTWGGTPRHRVSQKTEGFGVDGNGDGWADVYDPADAIPAAARYLKTHGAPKRLREALFAYNRSNRYVDHVLAWSRRYAADTQAATFDGDCADQPAPRGPAPSGKVKRAIAYARDQIGKPYRWGGTGPNTYDCSGLVQMAYRSAGVRIPRTTFEQWRTLRSVKQGRERAGDLVFFNAGPGTSRNNPGHVGLVTGGRRMIEARCTRCGPIAARSYRDRSNLVGFRRP